MCPLPSKYPQKGFEAVPTADIFAPPKSMSFSSTTRFPAKLSPPDTRFAKFFQSVAVSITRLCSFISFAFAYIRSLALVISFFEAFSSAITFLPLLTKIILMQVCSAMLRTERR